MIVLGPGHDWIPDGELDGERVHRCFRCATLSTWAGARLRCSGGGIPVMTAARRARRVRQKARWRERRATR